jgi:hypothetical protein
MIKIKRTKGQTVMYTQQKQVVNSRGINSYVHTTKTGGELQKDKQLCAHNKNRW